MKELDEAIKKLKSSRQTVALTGAGISTSSGIPDFRGANGLWKKYDPSIFAHIHTFRHDPAKVWELAMKLIEISINAQPNTAHTALADMENMGLLHGIISQNIDSLHSRAGSRNVIEYHGNMGNAVCPGCHAAEEVRAGTIPVCPRCGCIMKPGFTLFGEPVPAAAFLEAKNLASYSDVFIVAGTSANVQPAADLPFIAKENGAYIIEMNMDTTGLTNYITDCFIQGPLEETLPRLAAMLRDK